MPRRCATQCPKVGLRTGFLPSWARTMMTRLTIRSTLRDSPPVLRQSGHGRISVRRSGTLFPQRRLCHDKHPRARFRGQRRLFGRSIAFRLRRPRLSQWRSNGRRSERDWRGRRTHTLIRALRDPDGANLDRLQVVKGWVDASGETQERIYDGALSDGRAIVDERCDAPVGNTVDIEAANYTNAIGQAAMRAYWQDPDFDPARRAFYYVRVLEIPKPNWTT